MTSGSCFAILPRMGSRPKSRNGDAQPPIGMWHMLRDVLVASMNKGQLPVLALLLVVSLVIFRMPPEGVRELAVQVLSELVNLHLVGYALAVVLALSWLVHAKYQRRTFAAEMDRIAEERNKLQDRLLQRKTRSSR